MTAPGRLSGVDLGSATVTGLLAASELRAGDMVGARYRIEQLLGMGGMGLVYRAHDIELGIDVALKLLRPELATRSDAFDRFRQELLLARQVSSPHVVRIHDLVRHGEAWLISMDFVDGESLEHRLDREGRLPPDEALRICRQLAEGLAAAHKRGVVHRDLKPANVLLDARGEALVTDFGIARSAGATGITGSGVIIGTPEYLSPEQARAEAVDGRSDLYALGLILYEMLTGTLPFRGGTSAEMLAQRIVRSPPDADRVVPGLPRFAVRLCARLLALRPAHRLQRAEDVVRAIDDRRLPRSPLDRRRLLRAGALCALFAALLALGISLARRAPSPGAASLSGPTPALLAPMPVLAADGADGALAAGIGAWLGGVLSRTERAAALDPPRVERALRALRYDAASARRFRAQVGEALGASRLLEADLARVDDGWVLTLAAWPVGAAEPEWREASRRFDAAGAATALGELLARVDARLGRPGIAVEAPSAQALRLISADPPPPGDTGALDDRLDALAAAGSADAWWSLLEALDRAGRRADASVAARAAIDASGSATGAAAGRLAILADALLGDPEGALRRCAAAPAPAAHDLALRRLCARAAGEAGDLAAAGVALEAIVEADPRDGEAWFLLGKFSIMHGDARRAVDDFLVRAQVVANRLEDRRLLAETTNALGIGYAQLGQPEPAALHYERAAVLRGALGDRRGEALSLRNLATVRAAQGDFDAAAMALAQARSLLEPLGDAGAMADLVNAVGAFEEERGQFREALAAYREALGLRQSLGDARLIGESLLNVAFSYYQLGEFGDAEVFWRQATTVYADIDDRLGRVQALQGLGLAKIARGAFADARDALDASLDEAEGAQMAAEAAAGLAGLAELDRLEGRMQSALDRAERARRLFEAQQKLRGVTEMQLLRVQVLLDLGDWTAAGEALAAVEANAIDNREQQAMRELRRAELALGTGDAERARAAAAAALATAEQARSQGHALAAHLLLAESLAALGRPAEASGALALARDELARYTSTPLRLLLAEAALRLDPRAAQPDYLAARAALARLPAWGRAMRLHAAAASTLPEAADAARDAFGRLLAQTPATQQPALRSLARALDVAMDAPR